MREDTIEITGCSGKICGYNVAFGKIECTSGDGSCLTASLLKARESAFHDRQLIDATDEIKMILDGLTAPAGTSLSLVVTDFGLLLAWAEHGGVVPANAITSRNSNEEIAEALGLLLDADPGQSYQTAK